MSFWNPTDAEIEEAKKKRDEGRAKLKESWADFMERSEKNTERELRWEDTLNDLLDDPTAVAQLSDSDLEYYKITAQSEIERWRTKENLFDQLGGASQAEIRKQNKDGWAGLFELVGGLASNNFDSRVSKNTRLIRLIDAEQRRRIPPPSAATGKTAAEVAAERVAEIMTQVNELEAQRDKDMQANPTHAANINRRYRRLIDELLEKL